MTSAPIVPVTYKAIASISSMPGIDTARLFATPVTGSKSPIDTFLLNTDNINKLYLNYPAEASGRLPPELGAVVVLGYMSAVESYIRSIITGIIRIDRKARDAVAANPITFAAAYHLHPEMLPEALMEELSFSSASNLEKAISTTIGLKQVPKDVKLSMETFNKICHLRHCCVHRFGKLGTKNAIDLGLRLDNHAALLEGRFSPTASDIEDIADALQITVKTINNYLFSAILERTVDEADLLSAWQMSYAKDKDRFQLYYRLFALKSAKPASPAPKEVYSSFVKERRHKMMKILNSASINASP